MASNNNRKTWQGYYPRRTKTLRETIIAAENKHKKDYESEESEDDDSNSEAQQETV